MLTLNNRLTAPRAGIPDLYAYLLKMPDTTQAAAAAADVKAWANDIARCVPGVLRTDQNAAIARLVGDYNVLQQAFIGGFIDEAGGLVFTHAARAQLALELMARVLDPRLIRQKNHPICGPVSMLQDVCSRDALSYVDYVIGLATKRRGRLSVAGGRALDVRIRANSRLLTKHFQYTTSNLIVRNRIAQADYIGLASLRNSSNFLPYRSHFTLTLLEAGTTAGELARWMREAGYSQVRDRSRVRLPGAIPSQFLREQFAQASVRPHVQGMATALLDGYAVFLIGADGLFKEVVGWARHGGVQNTFMTAVGGHVVRVTECTIEGDGVRFNLVSWGVRAARLISWSKMTSWYRGYVRGKP